MISHDNPIPDRAIAAVLIQLFPFEADLSSVPAENIKNPQYNRKIRAIKAKIHKVQFIAIWINAITYPRDVV